MSDFQQYVCNFHGITIDASGPANVISALASRLGQLPLAGDSVGTFTFDFITASSSSGHLITRPRGEGRPFYVPLVGEAIYFPKEDEVYLDYGGRVRALCKPAEGHCVLSLMEPHASQIWLATHPLFTIPLLEMLKRRGKFNIHAAAFARNRGCVLLPGTTGVGKSTLTMCLLRAGLDFLGDDMAFVEYSGELRVLGFPESIDITDTTASFFSELQILADRPKRPGWPKHEVKSTEFFASQLAESSVPKAVIFPQIANSSSSRLVPITADEAFLELAPNVLLTDAASSQAQFEVLAHLVKSTPLYRLSAARDFDHIAQLVGETLQ